jgi:hypothetical protein
LSGCNELPVLVVVVIVVAAAFFCSDATALALLWERVDMMPLEAWLLWLW